MGTLILQDGTVIKGNSFGAFGGCDGEVIFNTSMSGYQEIFSDPTNAKQIIVMSYPEIGNCGINDFDFENQETYISGVIVKNYSKQESHYRAKETLSSFFKRKGIVALEGIDTRSLIRKLREVGSMSGFITSNEIDRDFINQKIIDLQRYQVPNDVIIDITTTGKYLYNPQGKINIALIDYGVRKSVLDSLAKKDFRITVYPATVDAQEILENKFDAVFLSSGPGNPNDYHYQILQIKQLAGKIPLFGIGLGCQFLAMVLGAKVSKMEQGHHGSNHPVINLENNKILMPYQNHSYVIEKENLPKVMRISYKNLNDDTIEGFEVSSLKIYAVQFNPESSSHITDASAIFDEWTNIAKRGISKFNEVDDER